MLLRPIEASPQRVKGIVISASSVEEAQQANVVAVGDRVENVKPGEVVLYDTRSHSLSPCTIAGESMVLIGEHDLLAVVEDA